MGTLVQDFRHAIRLLVRYPGFSFIAILTLTIWIGVNTTIFIAVTDGSIDHLCGDGLLATVVIAASLIPALGASSLLITAALRRE